MATKAHKWAAIAALFFAAAAAGQAKTHAEAGIGFSGRFRTTAHAGATLEFERVQFTGFGQYENRHNLTAALQGGLRLYHHQRTGVNTWLMFGPSYTWHSKLVKDSGEGVKNGLLPMMGLRFDYGRVTLDLNYNIETVGLRFSFQMFNNQE